MKNEIYITPMFPYPSGSGLHIGHFYNYAIIDSYCNYWRYKGYEVFQPFGYDSFGLPAENYAKQEVGLKKLKKIGLKKEQLRKIIKYFML